MKLFILILSVSFSFPVFAGRKYCPTPTSHTQQRFLPPASSPEEYQRQYAEYLVKMAQYRADLAEYNRKMAEYNQAMAARGLSGTATYETRNRYGTVFETSNYHGDAYVTQNYSGNTYGTYNYNGNANLTINLNGRSNVTINDPRGDARIRINR